ncbi:MAG: NnrS family protein [Rhodopila sp.]
MTAPSLTQTDPDRPVSPSGLKPSFLTGALWAGVVSLVALPVGFGNTEVATAYAPADWYAHEGLYGYLAAIITGFLLGAPGQRQRLPGHLLVVLMLAWLAGRLAILGSATVSAVVAGAIDSVFLLLTAALAVRAALGERDRTTLSQAGVIVALAAGNVLFHIGLPEAGKRIAIAAVVLLVTLVSGRPAARGGETPAADSFDYVDIATVSLSALALLAWIMLPGLMVTGVLMLVAGLAQAVRLVGWIRSGAGQSSLTLLQQIAYGLVPLGFLALGGSAFGQEPSGPANVRAWLVGAVGVLSLAMVQRADPDQAERSASVRMTAYAIYGAVAAAIGLRLFTGWIPALAPIAGAAWVVAFVVFVLGYLPLLARSRVTAP